MNVEANPRGCRFLPTVRESDRCALRFRRFHADTGDNEFPWRRRSDDMHRRPLRIRARALIGALGVLLVTTGAANAATLRATGDGYRYVAAPGEVNTVRAWTEGRTLHLTDTGASAFDRALPSGCVAVLADLGIAADCDARGDNRLRVELGDGNDRLEAWELPRRIELDVDTGAGENVVEAGAGDDRIVGGDERDTLYGGPGDDVVVGGDGNDYVRGNGGDDVVRGGEGLNFLFGDGGDDELFGGSSFEYFTAGSGDDVVHGGGGADDIGLGRGDDLAFGGADDDEIRGGAGADRMFGEGGNDLIRARDGESDRINCGGGSGDIARVDANELDEARRSCETIKQADAAPADPPDVDTLGS
jgi:Ca2+-binding RTX toxin-like protein